MLSRESCSTAAEPVLFALNCLTSETATMHIQFHILDVINMIPILFIL